MHVRAHLHLLAFVLLVAACDDEQGRNEQRAIVEHDQATVLRVVREDLRGAQVGVRRAAELMARGFLVEDPAQREREMRRVLTRVQQPPRAIEELMISPITFVAAVGADGKVICRDAEPDLMRGLDIAQIAPVVRRALNGQAGYELSELPSSVPDEPPSVTILFAAPARREGRVVGAIVAGLPLWRLTQQLSNQLQLEHAARLREGHLVWALVYRGDDLYPHAGFPPGLRDLAPAAAARREGLGRSTGGFTGQVQQYGRWYGYGVLPLPRIREDVGVVLFRSDPY